MRRIGILFTHTNSDFVAILACENSRFPSLLASGDLSRETSPAARSEEKRLFSQASAISVMGFSCAALISKAVESHTG